MTSNVNLTFVGFDGKRTTFSVPVAQITAANHDAVAIQAADIQTEIEDLTLGALAKRTVTHSNLDYVYTLPTNPYATRDTSVQFTLSGAVEPSNKVRVSLGAPDLSKFPFVALQSEVANAPFSNLHADLTAAITVLEGAVLHPATEEAMTVTKMELIGRNL